MNRIKQLREEIGMTQVRLSIELEVAQETISAYEHGKHYPSINSLIKMMDIFNAGIDYIMGFSDVRYPVKTLTDSEQVMINMFKTLSVQKQELALAYMQGLYDGQA
ncbi:MAG: helix-turn-helix transcriptional regulator [Ruminococcaceae bacterium]|nr:helix-turn-helix transcriptional regulator [Oscillospiraceae bacterium]